MAEGWTAGIRDAALDAIVLIEASDRGDREAMRSVVHGDLTREELLALLGATTSIAAYLLLTPPDTDPAAALAKLRERYLAVPLDDNDGDEGGGEETQ